MLSAVLSSSLHLWQHVGAQIHRGHVRSARGIGAGLCGELCNAKFDLFPGICMHASCVIMYAAHASFSHPALGTQHAAHVITSWYQV